MAIIWVDGVECPTPSSLTYGLTDVSSSDAGRTDDAIMYKGRIAQKRTLSFTWNNPDPSTVSTVLKMFNPEYFSVKYHDAMENENLTKTFYCGDRTAPFKVWGATKKRFSSLTFNIIEQ